MNQKTLAALGLALATLPLFAKAATVYSEGFTAGQFSPWTVGDAYWSNCNQQQNCVVASGGHTGAYFNLATNGAAATNYQPDHRFFISQAFAVNANANYTLTFYLRDNYAGNSLYNVPVKAMINGVQVGGLVKASTAGWNEFDLAWASGSATQATISLADEYQLSGYWGNNSASPLRSWSYGNDFALDDVSLSCSTNCGTTATNVPEPGSLMLAGVALAGLGIARRRRS